MRCSVGLEFNPVERVCDWPEHANCESRVSTTDASQETTVSIEEPEETTVSTEEPEIGTTEESASEKFEMFFD
ncbi:hypothetical protein WH47_00625 [Habropoda laboriosa]|uniref:Chitin-binding type-2 domain-containing protein n=2 Tax=Habropoda laboriosa TaxID=597456 RepID=A0A0L7RHZ6_9HYME|nr:hypothetical protein WH47_00625 [Habropoda laboriosa]